MFSSFRRVLAVSLFSAVCLGTFMVRDAGAQSTGVKLGLQWSTLRFDDAIDPALTRRPDILGGVFFQFGQRTIMAQLEGLVSRRGSRSEIDGVRTDSNVIYFEIPLVLRVNVAKMDAGAVFLGAGAALASRWQAHRVVDGVSTDAKADVAPYDVHWIVTGGMNFRHVIVDARYTRGILNVRYNAPDGAAKITNDSFGVSVGYGF